MLLGRLRVLRENSSAGLKNEILFAKVVCPNWELVESDEMMWWIQISTENMIHEGALIYIKSIRGRNAGGLP